MQLTHCGTTYDCATAVKCTDDCYIILYDENGNEIISFMGISDFTEFEISGGSFVDPTGCALPVPLSAYSIGGRTITTNDWIESESGGYDYEIASDLISANATTCNVFLLFAEGTTLTYTATQESGKIVLHVKAAPLDNIVINSIQITRT